MFSYQKTELHHGTVTVKIIQAFLIRELIRVDIKSRKQQKDH